MTDGHFTTNLWCEPGETLTCDVDLAVWSVRVEIELALQIPTLLNRLLNSERAKEIFMDETIFVRLIVMIDDFVFNEMFELFVLILPYDIVSYLI